MNHRLLCLQLRIPIERLITRLRYIFQAQEIAKHAKCSELEQEIKRLEIRVKLPAAHGEIQLIFGAKETPPSLHFTSSSMPGVEDEFLVLSLPISLPTHFCSLTHPLLTPPQERKWRWLGAHCT